VPIPEKDRLAAEVEDRWVAFQDGLSNKRRYPVEQFRAFWDAGRRYAELTKNDPGIAPIQSVFPRASKPSLTAPGPSVLRVLTAVQEAALQFTGSTREDFRNWLEEHYATD